MKAAAENSTTTSSVNRSAVSRKENFLGHGKKEHFFSKALTRSPIQARLNVENRMIRMKKKLIQWLIRLLKEDVKGQMVMS